MAPGAGGAGRSAPGGATALSAAGAQGSEGLHRELPPEEQAKIQKELEREMAESARIKEMAAEIEKELGIADRPKSGKSFSERIRENGRMSKNVEDRRGQPPYKPPWWKRFF